jgi:hypothetical protein
VTFHKARFARDRLRNKRDSGVSEDPQFRHPIMPPWYFNDERSIKESAFWARIPSCGRR